ncbi:MAG TPA: serine/threonine-protein kinase, partial [Methylomirabilota bacterium]|nr:serine/threonine-protein kinase [Methylomirabilota bacterium]
MPSISSHQCPKCGADLPLPGAECAHCLLALGFSDVSTVLTRRTKPDSEIDSNVRVFADYELLDEIARGGMGVVYRARQRSLGRTVALKLILGGQLATREFVRRFRAEATAAAALQHPNIVAIHDVGVHDGNHFFSMDYVEGQNLAQFVGNRPVPAAKAARYLKTIAEAIHYAHEQGILHRDLKPSNVLVDAATDQPRVTDFGLAKRLDGESSLTMTGQILGSPHFMPPEQADARRGKVGRRSDVYALGGILYFLLTARPPFQGESLETTLGQVLNVEPVSPRLLNPSVPRDLETICLKCLEKEPGRRYPTARAMAEDLERFVNGEPTLARPTTRIERAWRWCRRRPAITGLLATAVILLLTISIGSPIAAFRIQRALQSAKANLYSADLNVVQTALAEADLVHARELLDRHRPAPGQRDVRGFEWRYLW